MNTFKNKNATIQAASGLILIVSATTLISPQMRWLGFLGIGSSVSLFAATEVLERRNRGLIENYKQSEKAKNELTIKNLREEGANLRAYIRDAQQRELKTINELETAQKALETLTRAHNDLSSTATSQGALMTEKDVLIEQALEDGKRVLLEALELWESSLNGLITPKRWNPHPERQAEFKAEIEMSVGHWRSQLAPVLTSLDGLKDLLEIYYCSFDDLATLKVKILNGLHIREKSSLHQEVQRAHLELSSRIPVDEYNQQIEAYNARLSEFECEFSSISQQASETEQAIKETLDPYAQKLLATIESLENKVGLITQERDRLYTELQKYHKAQPFKGSSKADINGNRLIDFFLERGITCDAERCESHFDFDEIWLRPRGVTPEEMKKHGEAIQLWFELLEPPSFKAESGCIKVVLRTHAKDKSAQSNTIDERPDWMREVIQASNHYRIVAPTGRGKSTFLDNLMGCLQSELPSLSVTLLDPKYPFTKWNGKQPDYKGCDACLEGMEQLNNLIEERFKQATEDVEFGRPIRSFLPQFFAVDEMEELYDFASNPESGDKKDSYAPRLKYLLKRSLRLGRGLKGANNNPEDSKGIIVAYITQSPLCSRVGLNKSDFTNSTNIWIGNDAITIALEQELDGIKSTKLLAYLRRQLELRQQRKDEYFALVSTPDDTFIASLPKPSQYVIVQQTNSSLNYQELITMDGASGDVAPPLESSNNESYSDCDASDDRTPHPQNQPRNSNQPSQQKCPKCASSRIKKNGSKKGIQYFKCSHCGASFKQED